MTPINIPCIHDRIDKIYHIADIHFRNVKRHDEYHAILDKFYDTVKKNGAENSVIIIAGDLAHSKLETSPELTQEISRLLTKCSELTDVIVIPGNHDCNLNNRQRLDVIYPIVHYMKNDKVHYLKDNGLYIMRNILFSHFGIFSNVDEFITYKKIPSTYKNTTDTHIALYHGPLHKSTTDTNYEVSNVSMKPEIFDGFHFGILGDIHKQQTIHIQKPKPAYIPNGWVQDPNDGGMIMKEFPILRYPGSLIQQNHSEKIEGHGATIWNVTEKSYKHVELHNDYGFFTAEVHNGKLTTDISEIPKMARLRFRCFETEPMEVKRILEKIRTSHDIKEVSYIRGDDQKHINRGRLDKASLQKLNDYHFQNTLIQNYISAHKPKTSKKVIEKVFELNKIVNSKVTEQDKPSNIIWSPKIFKFDNMFSYGKGNIIDFSKLDGIAGIFGPNTSGKSSIFSALCFCLFDKCDRTFKAGHIMNESKMSFQCELNFEIGNVDFFVKRSAKKDKHGNVRVEVNFWKEVDGNRINLNDESRRSTNEVIRSYIGSFDDFVLTSLSPQNSKGSNFAEKGQTERKDLITKFLGIDIFDTIYQLALEDYKEISTKIKSINFEELYGDINILESELPPLSDRLSQMVDIKGLLVEEHSDILKKIIEKGSQITKIDGVSGNISDLELRLSNLEQKLETLEVLKWEETVNDCEDKISQETTTLEEYVESDLPARFENFKEKVKEFDKSKSKIEMLKMNVKNKLEKVKFLDEHEYNSDCEYCMRNAFVQDALEAKKELIDIKPIVDDAINKKDELSTQIENLKSVEEDQRNFDRIKTYVSGLKDDLHRFQNKLLNERTQESQIKSDIKEYQDKVSKYYKSIDIAKRNEELEVEILGLHIQEKELSSKINTANTKISDVQSDIKTKNALIEEKKGKLAEFKDLEIESKAFQIYIDAIHRDGVPYDIITKSVPTIEREVNEILSQIVEFGVMLDLDGKNINANLVYTDRLWPIELGSGMETFITNLALRIALTNISNMPKTNFLAIDEGFGSLDEDTFATIPALFSYLRNSFEFILIISHIDQVKDFVDTHIEIRKEKGFSHVNMI